MSYLSRLDADEPGKQPQGEPSKVSKGTSDPLEGEVSGLFGGIDADMADGLLRLQNMTPPRIAKPEVWREVVADCVRLATEGWANEAMKQGWCPHSLWGVSPAAGGMADLEGLGVFLAGRRIVRIKPRFCEIDAGPGARIFFNRRSMEGAVLVWELGERGHGR